MTPRSLVAATALGLTLTLAGCGDDPVPPAPSPSTPRATVSPSPTGPVAPVLPDAARANTPEGAEAFVRHWFEALTYAIQTGDTGPADAMAAKPCKACRGISERIHSIYDPGGRISGGGWNIVDLGEYPNSTPALPRYFVLVEQPRQQLINEHGATVSTTKKKRFAFAVTIAWSDGWRVHEGVERS